MEANIAMMAITTRSSMSVKPRLRLTMVPPDEGPDPASFERHCRSSRLTLQCAVVLQPTKSWAAIVLRPGPCSRQLLRFRMAQPGLPSLDGPRQADSITPGRICFWGAATGFSNLKMRGNEVELGAFTDLRTAVIEPTLRSKTRSRSRCGSLPLERRAPGIPVAA